MEMKNKSNKEWMGERRIDKVGNKKICTFYFSLKKVGEKKKISVLIKAKKKEERRVVLYRILKKKNINITNQ